MAATYVPPGRRNIGAVREQRVSRPTGEAASTAARPARDLFPKSYLVGDICGYFGDKSTTYNGSSTLHASTASPNTLAFVLLFHGANPKWQSDHILYVKSNLDLLRSETEALNKTNSSQQLPEAVAVFEQTKGSRLAKFVFTGWYKVTHVQFLSPRTTDLVHMLEQKWTKKDRHGNVSPIEREGEAWKRSLSQHWAVVKFEKDEVAAREKGVLDIPEKSVNELLQEMRLRSTAVGGTEGSQAVDNIQSITPLAGQDPNVTYARSNEGQTRLLKDVTTVESTKDVAGARGVQGAATSTSSNEV